MYQCVVMDSEYCSMGRWISVIVANAMGMSLYEGKDLLQFVDEDWLDEDYLKAFDERLMHMTLTEVKQSKEMKKVHQALSKAMRKAVEKGPCIIHERGAGEVLKDYHCLKVLLYNSNIEHRIPLAIADKTYDLKELSHDQLVNFIKHEDYKRQVYHDAICTKKWGEKESYDICLDSAVLSREKCAEILIEALDDVKLNLDECAQIIKQSFD
ncbi:MAG: AAA family ATPase [Longibaculum sp.]